MTTQDYWPEEGAECRCEGCTGKLEYPETDNCSCHINPPCSACTDKPLICQECEWSTEEL